MTLALNWKFALLVMVIVALVTFISDYIVVGTVTTVLLVPAFMAFTHGLYFSAILCIATAAILIKHRENYGIVKKTAHPHCTLRPPDLCS